MVINKVNMPALAPLTNQLPLISNISSDQLTDHVSKIHLKISLPCLSTFSSFPRSFLNKELHKTYSALGFACCVNNEEITVRFLTRLRQKL